MKKTVLFVLMTVFLSTNLYAEELHYHKEMFCLKPDGTPNGEAVVTEFDSIEIFDGDSCIGTDGYIEGSLQSVYASQALHFDIPTQIPSKKIEYDRQRRGLVTVEPISATQIYIYIRQDVGDTHVLMTYDPFTKTTRSTDCY